MRHRSFAKAISSYERHLPILNASFAALTEAGAGGVPPSPRGRSKGAVAARLQQLKTELAALHKKIGAAYLSFVAARTVTADVAEEIPTSTAHMRTYEHFSAAMQLGLDDKEIRRYFAANNPDLIEPHVVPTTEGNAQ
jgi:hypothetical protein